jgi:RNA polymerase sigma-70 factor (ECF subfamily)
MARFPGSSGPGPRRLQSGVDRLDRIRADASRDRAELARAVPPDAADAVAVHRALDVLDAGHREVLVLHFLEDMPLADIAAVVGCPEGTVKSRLFHAKPALREVLLRGGHETP